MCSRRRRPPRQLCQNHSSVHSLGAALVALHSRCARDPHRAAASKARPPPGRCAPSNPCGALVSPADGLRWLQVGVWRWRWALLGEYRPQHWQGKAQVNDAASRGRAVRDRGRIFAALPPIPQAPNVAESAALPVVLSEYMSQSGDGGDLQSGVGFVGGDPEGRGGQGGHPQSPPEYRDLRQVSTRDAIVAGKGASAPRAQRWRPYRARRGTARVPLLSREWRPQPAAHRAPAAIGGAPSRARAHRVERPASPPR